MANVTIVKGDLFSYSGKALAHGCNCAGAMGAGIAVAFKDKFPSMFEEYRRKCRSGLYVPGDVFTWSGDGKVVFNLATQAHFNVGATLQAIKESVTVMLEEAEDMGLSEVAMPKIGAGLGGLQWEDVLQVLQGVPSGVKIKVYEL